jgi:hypothetical protein
MHDLRNACGRAVSLLIRCVRPVTTTATSAQGKRNRRATCECAEAAPAWVVSVLSHSPHRHGEKPGIEEQHILSAVVSYSTMTTTTTGLLRGATIELERAVPEMDGQRVRVMLEPVEEERLSAQQQREFWRVWVERGPEGPIEDGVDTDLP